MGWRLLQQPPVGSNPARASPPIGIEMKNSGLKSWVRADDPSVMAVHEAGHAVVAVRFRLPFKYVTIIPSKQIRTLEGGYAGGHIEFRPDRTTYQAFVKRGSSYVPNPRIKNRIIALFAGISAQELYFKALSEADADTLAKVDFEDAGLLAQQSEGVSDDDLPVYLSGLREKSRQIVRMLKVHKRIELVEYALSAFQTLDEATVKALCKKI